MDRKKISFSKRIFFGTTERATFLSVWYMLLKYGKLIRMGIFICRKASACIKISSILKKEVPCVKRFLRAYFNSVFYTFPLYFFGLCAAGCLVLSSRSRYRLCPFIRKTRRLFALYRKGCAIACRPKKL